MVREREREGEREREVQEEKQYFERARDSGDWKDAGVLAVAVFVGRLFQSTIVRGKNENLRLSALQYGTG